MSGGQYEAARTCVPGEKYDGGGNLNPDRDNPDAFYKKRNRAKVRMSSMEAAVGAKRRKKASKRKKSKQRGDDGKKKQQSKHRDGSCI